MNCCADCIETKDKELTYAKCGNCEGWRKFTPQEQEKADCLDEDGSIIKPKCGAYQKKYPNG